MVDTIAAILAGATGRAIGAPGRAWMDGAALQALAAGTRAALNGAGIGRGDRVGIVLPNGPEMATCFAAVAATCTAAPLNPAYKADEFEFYLSDLKPRALILAEGDHGPARAVADRLGLPVIVLHPDADGPAGGFRLDTSALPAIPAAQPSPARRRRTTSHSCCTPPAPPRARRSCR